jgi:hypothetical protein
MFPGWAEYGDEAFLWRGPPTYDPLVVWQPRTWLLRAGWKKRPCDHALAVEVSSPGARRCARRLAMLAWRSVGSPAALDRGARIRTTPPGRARSRSGGVLAAGSGLHGPAAV